MPCFTTNVQSGSANITVSAFDESFGKWVHLQASSPSACFLGHIESSLSVPPAHAAAIGAALIAAAKAAGWVETVETGREVERVV
jgi:hypothetical protein